MRVYEVVLAAAAFLTACGVLVRALHLDETLKGTRNFLVDWQGEPARPGVEARPSFPERMASVEQQAALVDRRTAELNHELRGELISRLVLLHEGQDKLHVTADRNADAIARLDDRVTDHRRRNEQQVENLRADLDRRLRNISGDLLRAETFRAALVELGYDVDANPDTGPPDTE